MFKIIICITGKANNLYTDITKLIRVISGYIQAKLAFCICWRNIYIQFCYLRSQCLYQGSVLLIKFENCSGQLLHKMLYMLQLGNRVNS